MLEGNAGARALVFTVSISSVSTKNVKVSFATVAGTATAGSDFVAKTGTLKIKAGKTAGTILVDVTGDATVEPDGDLHRAPVGRDRSDARTRERHGFDSQRRLSQRGRRTRCEARVTCARFDARPRAFVSSTRRLRTVGVDR